MDRSVAHSDRGGARVFAFALRRVVASLLWFAAALAFAGGGQAASAAAPQHNPGKLYVDADQIVYDKDHDIVTATGNVVLYYENRVLQADKVTYDRNTKRVLAEGHVKFTDEQHNVFYEPRFDLTDDFANGFADSVEELAVNKTRLTSPRIERSGGDITVLDKAIYTACEPCKAHPELPPEWQVRAVEITENQLTHTVYFDNAWLDIFGFPIAYVPYMSAPDSTVVRQTGVLAPYYSDSSNLGLGVGVPYFMALAPNYDLTLTPIYYSQQGPAFDALWRQRLDNGQYNIRISGVDQGDPTTFAAPPSGAGNLTYRGSVQSEGQIYLNTKWTLGWDLNWFTDRYYLNDYKLTNTDPAHVFLGEVVSSAYLRGQDGRGFFDLSGYGFMPTSAYLDQKQDPVAAPVFDYHRTFPLNPNAPYSPGGELSLELNAQNIDRTEALYQAVGKQLFDTSYNLYGVCSTYTPGTSANNCLLRGIAGDTARATAQVAWQTKYVDPIGEVWSPFVFARASGAGADLNTTGAYTYGDGVTATNGNTIPNYAQPAFFNGQSSSSSMTAMPGVGLEWRYPFVSNSFLGQQVIEPIAQVIVRPNEVASKLQPNEDAQSLVFDTTNLFSWSKYSGYDRVEGGTRLNYGLQYTDNFADGGHFNFVTGESIQLAGQNSYTIADAVNTGLDSGLDKQYSDFVASETLQPFKAPVSFISKQQIDSTTGQLDRLDGILTGSFGAWSATLDYAQYAAQPELGWQYPRQGIMANANYHTDKGLTLSGGVTFDMSRQYYDVAGENTPRFYATGFNVGLGYETSCTMIKATYTSVISDPLSTTIGVPPTATRDQTLLLQITLRTLGDVKASIGSAQTTGAN